MRMELFTILVFNALHSWENWELLNPSWAGVSKHIANDLHLFKFYLSESQRQFDTCSLHVRHSMDSMESHWKYPGNDSWRAGTLMFTM